MKIEKDKGQECRYLEKRYIREKKSPLPRNLSRRAFGSLALEEKLNKNAKLKIMNI